MANGTDKVVGNSVPAKTALTDAYVSKAEYDSTTGTLTLTRHGYVTLHNADGSPQRDAQGNILMEAATPLTVSIPQNTIAATGQNVTVTSTTKEDGALEYTINATDTNTVTDASVSTDGKTLTITKDGTTVATFNDTDTRNTVVAGNQYVTVTEEAQTDGSTKYIISGTGSVNSGTDTTLVNSTAGLTVDTTNKTLNLSVTDSSENTVTGSVALSDIQDGNTTYSVTEAAGSGNVVKTYTLTGSDNSTATIEDTDTNTTYSVMTTAGTGNVVNSYEIKDNDGNSVATLQDTDTKYSAGDNVTIDSDNKISAKDTTYSVTEAAGSGKVVKTYTLTGSDGSTATIEDTDTRNTVAAGTNVTISEEAQTDGSTKYTINATDKDTHASVKAGDTNLVVDGSGKNAEGAPEYKVSLAKDVKVNSVTATTVNAKSVKADTVEAKTEVKVGNTSIKKDGIRVGKSMVFTQNNVNMGNQQVHGVAAGTAPTDAVNVSQLQATEAQINQRFASVDKHVDRVEDNAYAGVAMALATAGLPQAWQPGKSMIAMAAGTYMGEQGYAVGFSHNTENGKWTLKATASGNSQGHFGGSVGAGYMW